jgi:cytochrome c oxidase subunit IV
MNSVRRTHRRNLLVWLALMLLLALTTASAFLPLGMWNGVLNLGIATAKAMLVALSFMHLRRSHGTVRLAAGIALFMLAILFGFSATDYANRRISPAPWQTPRQLPVVVPAPQTSCLATMAAITEAMTRNAACWSIFRGSPSLRRQFRRSLVQPQRKGDQACLSGPSSFF